MSKSALTVLREARELISDPKRWTQGAFARNASGCKTGILHADATCWCTAGALLKVSEGFKDEVGQANDFLDVAACQISSLGLVGVNDELGHSAVLRMFDAAIASAEKEAQA